MLDCWPSPQSLDQDLSGEGVGVCQAMELGAATPDLEHNTSLIHSSTRCSFQPFLIAQEMVTCGSQHLLWRTCGFSLLLLQSLNPRRNSTSWLMLGLKNGILHLHVSNHPNPRVSSSVCHFISSQSPFSAGKDFSHWAATKAAEMCYSCSEIMFS